MKKNILIITLILLSFSFLINNVQALDYKIRYDESSNSETNDNNEANSNSQGVGHCSKDEYNNPISCADNGGTWETDGCNELGAELIVWLKNALKFTQYVGVGLAVVLTAVDFIQVVGGSKEDDLKKAFDRSIKRLIAVVLLLLTSVIVTFIIQTFIVPTIGDIDNCIKSS